MDGEIEEQQHSTATKGFVCICIYIECVFVLIASYVSVCCVCVSQFSPVCAILVGDLFHTI